MRQGPFYFGDYDLTNYLAVSSVTRPIMPARRIETTEVPGKDGVYTTIQGLSSLEIVVNAHILRRSLPDVNHLRRILASMMLYEDAQPLRLPDEPWAYHLALYQGGAELTRHVNKPGVKLTFLCTDPIAYGQSRTATVSATSTKVRTGGTYKAYPIVRATPTTGTSYWRIMNVDTGDYVRVDATSTFASNTSIVLDMGLQRCTVNGSNHAVTIDSDYFSIEGEVQLMSTNGSATLEWEERWL